MVLRRAVVAEFPLEPERPCALAARSVLARKNLGEAPAICRFGGGETSRRSVGIDEIVPEVRPHEGFERRASRADGPIDEHDVAVDAGWLRQVDRQ